MGLLDRLADLLEDVADQFEDAADRQSNSRSGSIHIPRTTVSPLPSSSQCDQSRSPITRGPSPPPQRHTDPGVYPTPRSLMPQSSSCLSAREFIDRISQRRQADIDEGKLAHYRGWLQNDIIPVPNRSGGGSVSERSMEFIIDFFGGFLFWNKMKRTRSR